MVRLKDGTRVELPAKVLKRRDLDPVTWHVVRRENLSSWLMPRGEHRAPVRGAGFMTMQEIRELDEQFESRMHNMDQNGTVIRKALGRVR